MEERQLTCICCPIGCQISVRTEGRRILSVEGNHCGRGAGYAEKEVVAPTRIVTSTMAVRGGRARRIAVKTASDIPKEKIFEVMREIHRSAASAPKEIGDVLIHDVAGTGVDVIATRGVGKAE